MTVGSTCGTEKIGTSHDRTRSCTYPSLEIWGQAPLRVLCTHRQVRFLLSPLPANAPLFRVEHCHSNHRRFAFVGQRGKAVSSPLGSDDREVSCCVLYRAPCACHGDFFKITRLARSLAPWPPARTSRTACSLSRAPASASCVEAGASSFFST